MVEGDTPSSSGLGGSDKGTSFSCQVPMLNATNYTVWEIRMKVILNVHQVWDVIDPGANDPKKDNVATEIDPKKNNVAIAVIFQAILEDLILQVGMLDTTKEIWDAIKTRNMGADRVK